MSVLTLPEEMALLLHLAGGTPASRRQASAACAAAELAELALRGRIVVRSRPVVVGGVQVPLVRRAEIEPRGTGWTGLEWADGVLAELARRGPGPIPLRPWVVRRDQLPHHREVLIARGLMRRLPGGLLVRDRHLPDPVLARVSVRRIAAAGQRVDGRGLLLSDLVAAAELVGDLALPEPGDDRMNDERGFGRWSFRPEHLRDTSFLLASAVPKRTRFEVSGDGDGGDGGGGE
ncbi:GPP34 family phosphoprotein [Saccharopolyspora cebuensis]|uniref:GPP34 family phosphoprotein n=1 Tax=Saccharopolyspora cebuensis TaxID=418759 RepID=A0ABV4CQB7_9PSEU